MLCRFMVDDAKTHPKIRINICIHYGENEAWEKTCPRINKKPVTVSAFTTQ